MTVDDLRGAVETDIRRNWSDAAWCRWLDAAAVLRDQSFRNIVLIKLQMPGAEWVDGRQGWQRRGRRIARGASGIRIIAPAPERECSAGPVQGHGVATVWDVSQTDGRPLQLTTGRQAQDVFAALEQVAIAGGYRVDRGRLVSDSGGAETLHRGRRIVVADDLDVPMATMALAHELAHHRMHKRSRESSCHGIARLEASSVAFMLASRLGCLPDQPTTDLIATTAGIVGRTPPVRQVETLGGRVVAAANRLYDAVDRYLSPPQMRPGAPAVAFPELATHSPGAEVAERGLEP
ncbi:hypothetical protein JOF29_006038 [Kribbella aluminosa]|uniref:ImmA/IrrE family metallo-endopeptidase n=1 Tax=Kribbella aluminosa TaxID=416017 RepID=A0ABS4UTF9_9ACTN|nr:hypothetical protein [Kribbella aluminosa]MBP2354928.1 hypothetical protein [Kribbella aluminosa]